MLADARSPGAPTTSARLQRLGIEVSPLGSRGVRSRASSAASARRGRSKSDRLRRASRGDTPRAKIRNLCKSERGSAFLPSPGVPENSPGVPLHRYPACRVFYMAHCWPFLFTHFSLKAVLYGGFGSLPAREDFVLWHYPHHPLYLPLPCRIPWK